MGTDIHWAIELRHPDGGWEAVASKGRVFELDHRDFGGHMSFDHPWMKPGDRNYALFNLLSDVRATIPDRDCPFADPGIPEDASSYVRENFGENGDSDYHSEGWFTLARLRDAVMASSSPHWSREKDRAVLEEFYHEIVALFDGPEPIPRDTILVGPECDGTGYHPHLRDGSHHARLERIRRAGELLPPGPDTVRVVVAYDN